MTLLPKRRSERLVAEELGSEILLYDERNHKALCLNPVAAAVWQRLDVGQSLEQVAEATSRDLQQPVDVEAVAYAVDQFHENDLLEPSSFSSPAPFRSDRRTLLARMGVTSLAMIPLVTAMATPCTAQADGGVLGDTPVRLASGATMPIASIRNGEQVATVDMQSGRMGNAKVIRVHRTSAQRIHKLTTASGDTLYASPTHLLLARFGDPEGREAGSLAEGETVVVYHPKTARFVESALVLNQETSGGDTMFQAEHAQSNGKVDVYHLETDGGSQAIVTGGQASRPRPQY